MQFQSCSTGHKDLYIIKKQDQKIIEQEHVPEPVVAVSCHCCYCSFIIFNTLLLLLLLLLLILLLLLSLLLLLIEY